jgi:replicative DNA helicase
MSESGFDTSGPRRGRRDFAQQPALSAKQLFEKDPPQSPEAEMSLLGSMILDPNCIADVMGIVRGRDDFYREAHGHIYQGLVDLYDARNTGDLVQLLDMLRDRKVEEAVGGAAYLAELANAVPTAANAPHFARIVAEKAKLRRLIDAAGSILYDAYHVADLGPEGAKEVLDRAEMRVFEIAQEQDKSDPEALADLLQQEMDRIEAADLSGGAYSGVTSGYGELDELLRGFQPGEMLILAARPSMGKTAFVLNIAEQVAIGGVPVPGARATSNTPVGLFSLEMSKSAIVQRLLSARARVSSQFLRGGSRIPDDALRRLYMAGEDLKHAPIYIDDTPNLTVLNLRARARRMVAQHGVRLILIDYLQLMSAPGAARESRQVEVSTISRGVKALARELKIPIICLSQLNRASEQREGNRPRMADLRESGSIEQDADVIMLLHREEYYHVQNPDWAMENPDKVGIAEVIIAKQRNGPTGVVKLRWDRDATRFANVDFTSQAPGGFRDEHADVFAPAPAPRPAAPHAAPHAAPGYAAPGYSATGQAASYVEPSPMGGRDYGDVPFEPDAGAHAAPGSAPKPRSTFAPGKKTGPISNHRDGGGPDNDAALGDDYGDIPV